jgi:transcriptional regulator with GAF, ATPase, and Fis domain
MVKRHGFDEMTTEVHADPPTDSSAAGPFKPEISWTDAGGHHACAFRERAVIGSAPASDIAVTDPTVSRVHAELYLKDQTVWVRDLGSRNGTFVQSVEVREARVPDGARLRVGATELLVRCREMVTEPELWPESAFGLLVGGSAAMRALYARLARIARDDSTVLIQGETGTGKELVARTLHAASARAAHPFVVIDCGALPETLLESELFGHARGAFTGATHSRAGAFESAESGTVFLDEVGELPLPMQPKILRVLESRAVRRIGESQHRDVEVRIIAATHRDLGTMVNEGAFREDLYFRLAVLPVNVPPLRARLEDIPALVRTFMPPAEVAFGEALITELGRRSWLGNVRELRNFVARAKVLGAETALAGQEARAPGLKHAEDWPPVDATRPFRELRARLLDHLEREYLRKMLAAHEWNISAVAKAAELDRTYVYRLMRKHDL